MGCLFITYPSTTPGLGYGSGGLGGGSSIIPLGAQTTPSGVEATAQIGVPLSSAPGPRTFVIAGIDQITIAAGLVMLPTSEDVNRDGVYAKGSSQFYTIGEVYWNNSIRVQGTDWELANPFRHIIRILVNPATISTSIRLIYYGWDIGVRTGFQVTSYPVPFAFVGTTILAERVPQPNQFFTVNYMVSRRGTNPMTMFARYPMILDDILSNHLLYDGSNGFETYRPAGYRVFDQGDRHVYEWNGTIWNVAGTITAGTKFYVKREHAIYQFDGAVANLIYTAGDPFLLSIPEALSYPVTPLPTELFGESIGKNLLQDAFSTNASVDFPSAYMIAQRPGDYDEWIAEEFG